MEAQYISESRVKPDYDIDLATYDRSARVFRQVKRLLKVNFGLHGNPDLIRHGHIFLFNHFARFETFIPQYLFYEAERVYCVSVASAEFFEEDNLLSGLLRDVGVIPNNYRRLLPWLAEQILRGRKVVIFPEGGMVKDRRVLDQHGHYSIFSRGSMDRRKHHTGAAVLALCLDLFKAAVRRAARENDQARLDGWVHALNLDSREALVHAARQSTLIVPGNITFYPLRVDEHILTRTADFLKHRLSPRHAEELLIEGNILLRDTDMDIQLGRPIRSGDYWRVWEGWMSGRLAERITSLDEVFAITRQPVHWDEQLLAGGLRRCVNSVRNDYMREMYRAVTVNLIHLASTLIMLCLDRGRTEIGRETFHRALYLAVRHAQRLRGVHLHHGLKNPDEYRTVLTENHPGLREFFAMTERLGLIESHGSHFRFLPKLLREHDFDEIRLENPVAVYANEVEPLSSILRVAGRALASVEKLDPRELSNLRFSDELVAWRWDAQAFAKPECAAVNRLETLTETAGPFFLKPRRDNGAGVILIHELLACPAELRGLGERLADLGYVTLGARLKGHGTSPCDLDRTRWEDWLDSVRRAYDILKVRVNRLYLVGAGAGGLLALRLAAESPERLAGVAAVSLPYRFGASAPIQPLLRNTQILRRWIAWRSDQPFMEREPEYPHMAYRQVSLRALYELRQLVADLDKQWSRVRCPVFLAQADRDPLLDPSSTQQVHDALATSEKVFRPIHAHSHNPIVDDQDGIQEQIIQFLEKGIAAIPAEQPPSTAMQEAS
jgi:esterase/lipase